MSGSMKLMGAKDVVDTFATLGFQEKVILPLGVVELLCAILYLVPRTSVLGAILLTGYLGGATCAHVRVDEPFIPPVLFGMLIWAGLALRDPRLRSLLPLRS